MEKASWGKILRLTGPLFVPDKRLNRTVVTGKEEEVAVPVLVQIRDTFYEPLLAFSLILIKIIFILLLHGDSNVIKPTGK